MNNKLENTIVDIVKKAVRSIEIDVATLVDKSFGSSVIELAASLNVTTDAFVRREIVDQMTTCYAYTDLAKIDSGLSSESGASLLALEDQMIKITNAMIVESPTAQGIDINSNKE